MAATAPYDSGRSLLNFSDRPTLGTRLWDDLDQRRAVKTRVDGGDLFVANHPIES
jgi:hypothetical protein